MKINNVELTKLMTTQEVADYFRVNTSVVTQKFCRNGLKYIELSKRDYRYNIKDVLEFEESIKKQDTTFYKLNDFYNIKGKNYKKCTFRLE